MGEDFIKGLKKWMPLPEEERRTLIACSAADKRPLPAPSPNFNWEAFAHRAIVDGVSVLAYQRLKDTGEAPAATLAKLKQDYYRNIAANHARLNELRRLGALLNESNEQGIPLLVLKGAALALTVYDDPAQRYMGDIDVAVPPQCALAAFELLQKEGYRLRDSNHSADGLATLRHQGWHINLSKRFKGQKMELEFHWPLRRQALVNQVVAINIDQFWESATLLPGENNLYQLSPPMMLLHLCIHAGIQHRFNELGLRLFADIDRLLRRRHNDPQFWAAFVMTAKKTGASQASYFCLQLVKELFAAPMPATILNQLQPSAWKRHIFNRVFSPVDVINRTRALHDKQRLLWRLLTTDSLTPFLTSVCHILFPGRADLATYYANHNPIWTIYYAVWHPCDMLWRAAARRWREIYTLSRHLVPARRNG